MGRKFLRMFWWLPMNPWWPFLGIYLVVAALTFFLPTGKTFFTLIGNFVTFAQMLLVAHIFLATGPLILLLTIPLGVGVRRSRAHFARRAQVAKISQEAASEQYRLLSETWHSDDFSVNVEKQRTLVTFPHAWEQDQTISDPKNDPLRYGRFVDIIARLIVASADNTPFAISIEAEWGMGKTSAMQMLRRQLHNQSFILYTQSKQADSASWKSRLFRRLHLARVNSSKQTDPISWKSFPIWFNAWKYRGEDVQRALLRTVFKAIPQSAFKGYLGSITVKQMVELGLDAAGRAAQLGDMGALFASRLDIQARYRNQFEDDFNAILKRWADIERHHRVLLVVFIDDLDRCMPNEIASILEMMKLFFATKGCVFVLGFDPNIVAASIEHDYTKKVVNDGLIYLKKLVQLNYTLPRPGDEAFGRLIDAGIQEAGLEAFFTHVPDYQQLILQGSGWNPREINRFLNALVVSAQLAQAQLEKEPTSYKILCILLLLHTHWPRCYLAIVRKPELVDDIYEYLALSEAAAIVDPHQQAIRDALKLRLNWLANQEDLWSFLKEYSLRGQSQTIDNLVSSGLPITAIDKIAADQSAFDRLGDKELQESTTETLSRVVNEVAALKGQLQSPKSYAFPAFTVSPPFDEDLLPLPEPFIGRSEDLRWVVDRLRLGGATSITALRGMAGIGKTSLAARAVHQMRQENRFPQGIAVMLCQGLVDASDVLRRVLARFDAQRRQPQAFDPVGLAEITQRLLEGKKVLIVLDNIEPGLAVEQVVLPLKRAGATLLLTSRQVLSLDGAALEYSRQLDLLSSEEALELLLKVYLGEKPTFLSPSEHAAAERIVAALDRHTLAIKLAGAYAANLNRNLETLADELQDPLQAIELPAGAAPGAVGHVFAKSTRLLEHDALRFFVALAVFSTSEFGYRAALAMSKVLKLATPEASLNMLVLRALVDRLSYQTLPDGSDSDRLHLHPLLHAFAREKFARWPEEKRKVVYQALAAWYIAYSSKVQEEALEPDEANIAGMIEWAHTAQEDAVVANLCANMQFFWRNRWRTSESKTYIPWGMASGEAIAATTTEPEDQLRLARLKLTFAQVLYSIGKPDDAEPLLQESLRIYRQLGARQEEGETLTSLGQVARRLGQLALAETHFLDALAIARKVGDRQGEGAALTELGQIAHQRGRLGKAEEYDQQALTIAREAGNKRGLAEVLTSLGQIAQQRGQMKEAVSYFQEARQIANDVQDRRAESTALTGLGHIALVRGQFQEAATYFQEALQIPLKVENQQGEGVVRLFLGRMALMQGDFAEAEAQFQESLEIRRTVKDRRGEGAVLAGLGWMARLLGDLDMAEQRLEKSLAILREVEGRLDEGGALYQLALIAQARGKMDRARQLFQESLNIAREVEGASNMVEVLVSWSQLLIKQDAKQEEVCSMLKEALQLSNQMKLPIEKKIRETLRRQGCKA